MRKECAAIKVQEQKKQIYLSSPTMNGKEMTYIKEAFETNWVAPLGKNVTEFEKEIAETVGVKSAAALASGTAAIHMALKCADVKKGDIVLCSTLTFFASCNPILYEGAIPVFIDSEKESWNMDPLLLRKALEIYPEAKAVIVVNLYGTPAKLDEIVLICKEYGIPLIEDAAESLGASLNGIQTGTFGTFGAFSFNGNKIITTSGGGMLVSDDAKMIEKARFWSAQSKENVRHYEHKEIGYNYRMSNIAAGIGRGQLKTLYAFIAKKKEIYEQYKQSLEKIEGVFMNPIPKQVKANYWLSCLMIERKEVEPLNIIELLEGENIQARPIWKPMHLQPVFKNFYCVTKEGLQRNTTKFSSVAEEIYCKGICLPSDIKNTREDMEHIIERITSIFL